MHIQRLCLKGFMDVNRINREDDAARKRVKFKLFGYTNTLES